MIANFQGQAPLFFGEGLFRFFGRLGVWANAGLSRQIFNKCQPFIFEKCILLLLRHQSRKNLGCTHLKGCPPLQKVYKLLTNY